MQENKRKTSARRRVEEGRPYNKKQENKTMEDSRYTRLNSRDVLLVLSLRSRRQARYNLRSGVIFFFFASLLLWLEMGKNYA